MSNTPEQSFVRRTSKNVGAGTAGGIAVCLVGHPFDTLKVRLQTQPIQKPIYSGLYDCLIKTLKWEGPGGLYKGVGSPIVGQMFFRATLFTSYYQFTTLVGGAERVRQRLSQHEYFLCGALTGSVAAFVESPIDLLKTKMQVQIIRARSGEGVQYRNVFHAGWCIVRGYGLRGFYQGLSASIMRNIPANAFYFGFYEMVRDALTPDGGTVQDLGLVGQLASGASAGLTYWSLTYPTDVVKSAMQSDDLKRSQRNYHNVVDCVLKLYHDEGGWKRFFRGFTPCMLRSIPANATMLIVVDHTRQLLNRYF